MKTHLESKIPFPGFYESWYDHEFDNTLEWDSEHYAEEWKVDAVKVAEAILSVADWSKGRQAVAKLHCERWLSGFEELTGVKTGGWEFVEMTSPKEYNFATDRVFVRLARDAVKDAFNLSRKDEHRKLGELIVRRFTSCDGFMSFYSNDLEKWLAKPLAVWDHNEIETLLIACVELKGEVIEDFNAQIEQDVIEYGRGNGYFEVDYSVEAVKAKCSEVA